MNEGVKRLAILTGVLGVVSWLIAVMVMSKMFSDFKNSFRVWGFIIGVSVLCFTGPFGLVHGIGWVIRGFRKPSEKKNEQSSNRRKECRERGRRPIEGLKR